MIQALCLAFLVGQAVSTPQSKIIASFDGGALPHNLTTHNAQATVEKHDGRSALKVDFSAAQWPNVYFDAGDKPWDWSAYRGIAVDVYNPGSEVFAVAMRIDNAGADGMKHCNTGYTMALPHHWTTFKVRWNTGHNAGPFWGMRGVPIIGAVPLGTPIDPTKITAFQFFLPDLRAAHTLYFAKVRLIGDGRPLSELVPLPFVDRFGQYKHADWPGKLHDESEFAQRRKKEAAELKAHPSVPGRDRFGGAADGPQLKGSGWFRTQKVDGHWWLVTPEGHIFFSIGMNCVGTNERTFVTKREAWFDWLPKPDEKPFSQFYGYMSHVHSMAEPIGGKGRTFSFNRANLVRKYGDDWQTDWRNIAYARLRAWGFNTIGNWSQGDVLSHSPMPFVVSLSSGSVRTIEGARGYWGHMKDVYDPGFPKAVAHSIAAGVKPYKDNPLCIGYFVDNELSWETVANGPLLSPPDQPCRKVLVGRLKSKYATLDALNKAWGTHAESWDALRPPKSPNAAATADLGAFVHDFAKRYFTTIRAALRHDAPHQLYLGCRFSTAPREAVKACAEVADVVSFNIYRRNVDCDKWTGKSDLGKPILIGEFHFGALDRGMFHTGLVPTQNQADRAQAFANYVLSVARCPAFVGCHWFQFVDEPITGRPWDGENYNIGFLDVTDSPYPELVAAAKRVNAEIYPGRSGK